MKKHLLIIMTMLMPIMANAYDFEVDGVFYTITSIEDRVVQVTHSDVLNYQQTKVVIPAEVDWNGYHFFVKSISSSAFDKSNYPHNVDTLIISHGVETIGDYAFQTASFRMLSIPNTISSIGRNAFNNNMVHFTDWYVEDWDWLCSSGFFFPRTSKDIYVDNTKLTEDLLIPEEVKYIAPNTFHGLEWIKTLKVSGNVEYIDASAFGECINLEEVEIENGVKEIYGEASKSRTSYYSTGTFAKCYKLEKVTLPNSINYIGDGAFTDSPNLKEIDCYINDPFPISSCFSNGQYLSATLNVPVGTKSKYQSVDGWKNFVNIVESLTPSEVFHSLFFSVSQGGYIIYNGNKFDEYTNNSIAIKEGEDAILRFIPDEGYRLSSLTIDGKEVLSDVSDSQYIIKDIQADVIISACFEEIPISITIQHADNGYVKQFVQRGSKIKFVLVPEEGWIINTVIFNGSDVTSELNAANEYITPFIYSDAMLSVSFESTQSAIYSNLLSNAKAYGFNGQIIVKSIDKGDMIVVYDESGKIIAQTVANGNEQRIALQAKGFFFVKVNDKTVKVSL